MEIKCHDEQYQVSERLYFVFKLFRCIGYDGWIDHAVVLLQVYSRRVTMSYTYVIFLRYAHKSWQVELVPQKEARQYDVVASVLVGMY